MYFGDLDWDKLRVCRAVAEAGSMAGAAARLNESQATVSRKVDEIESKLGTLLFSRSSRGIELTEAGRNAMKYMDIMAEAANDLRTQLSEHDDLMRGSVTIIAGDGLGAHWIAPRLPDFHRQFPEIELRLDILDDVTKAPEASFDISIQFSEATNREMIQARLGRLHYTFFASHIYLNSYGVPKSLLDLAEHRCISHTGYVFQTEVWPDKAEAYKQLISPALATNSGAVMREVCGSGGGIALLPSYFVEVDRRLVPLDLGITIPIDFWLVYPERSRRLTRSKLVIEWLKSIFEVTTTPWFRPTPVKPVLVAENGHELQELRIIKDEA